MSKIKLDFEASDAVLFELLTERTRNLLRMGHKKDITAQELLDEVELD